MSAAINILGERADPMKWEGYSLWRVSDSLGGVEDDAIVCRRPRNRPTRFLIENMQ
ncbi:MAG: hypothetical protein M0006_15620 [Magnetospirillum sp.]|nr:hypothetical protein [Magnetospirillum sp.]